MKKAAIISSLCFLLLTCILSDCLANNITVSAISLTNRNTSTKTVRVNFDLSWDNSWRTTSAPFNWDAAWVFVKYRVGTTGEWKHATLATSGHTLPGIAASSQTDATGIFIYRSAAGTSTFNPTGIQLQWNYGIDGVANEARIFVRVFAIEMVYNQVGGFQAGSGGHTTGELRTANDVSVSGTATTFTITGSLPTVQGNSSSSSPTNIATRYNGSNDISGTTTASLATGYPTGFNAFYSMKYEISQQQYVDFLNTLTYTQQAARTAATSPPNSAAGTGALISGNLNRNGIDIQTPGTASTVPAVYACNLNASNGYNDVDDGQHIACNYLSWDDLTAYLDWAGLRPMTELEFEKSCRGNQPPVSGEYPWGTTSATALTGLTNAGLTNELASNSTSNIAFTNAYTTGPVRNGIFATATNSRSTSGAGYYGNMELGGNLWERVVTIGASDGRTFSATHGNGTLTTGGAADVAGWPAATGSGWKGGAYDTAAVAANSSGRTQAANGNNNRVANAGGRGVRTVTTGIITNGLVLWLDAGITPSYPGTGTTWTDLSGNRNDGILTNGPTYNSSNGGLISFNGTNQYVIFTRPNSIVTAGQITISLWAKWVTTGSTISSIQALIDNNHSSSPLQGFIIQDRPDLSKFLTWSVNPNGNGCVSTFVVGNGSWRHIVGTNDGSTSRLYIDGTLNASFSESMTTVQPNISLGYWQYSPSRYLNGNIAQVTIYNRALSAAEVLQYFNAQKARFGL
jgi:formylglycine-generating enzyme required for sulfatase activity